MQWYEYVWRLCTLLETETCSASLPFYLLCACVVVLQTFGVVMQRLFTVKPLHLLAPKLFYRLFILFLDWRYSFSRYCRYLCRFNFFSFLHKTSEMHGVL